MARVGAWTRVVALVIAPFNAVVGLALYGASTASVPAAHPTLLPPDNREAHRLAGRLGNVAAPLVVAALATGFSTDATFFMLAAISAVAALRLRGPAPVTTPAPDDDVRIGSRLALVLVTVAVIAELPIHLAVFAHLGALGLTVPVLALIAAIAELAGVVFNLALRDRRAALLDRPRRELLVMVVVTGAIGVVAVFVSINADTAAGALVAITIGSVAASAAIPFLTIGTRAVIGGHVGPVWPLTATVVLAFVPAIAVTGAGVTAVASAVVSKVTPKQAIREATATLE